MAFTSVKPAKSGVSVDSEFAQERAHLEKSPAHGD